MAKKSKNAKLATKQAKDAAKLSVEGQAGGGN